MWFFFTLYRTVCHTVRHTLRLGKNTETIKNLLSQTTTGPWTVQDNKWDETIVANESGHLMSRGEQVRFEFLAGNPEVDPQLAALARELAQEVTRLRAHVNGIACAMDTKAENGEMQDPEIVAGYLREITLRKNH